jgi:hypothetical protein
LSVASALIMPERTAPMIAEAFSAATASQSLVLSDAID